MRRTLVILTAVAALAPLTAAAHFGPHGHGHSPPHRPQRQADVVSLAQACERAFEGRTNEGRCLEAVLTTRGRSVHVAMIDACERAFEGDANELACVQRAVRGVLPETISACERAFAGDANELRCVEQASYGVTPATVDACESAFSGDENELACLAAVAGSHQEPTSIVAFCQHSAYGDADELACIARFRSSEPRGLGRRCCSSEVCDRGMMGSSEPRRRPHQRHP